MSMLFFVYGCNIPAAATTFMFFFFKFPKANKHIIVPLALHPLCTGSERICQPDYSHFETACLKRCLNFGDILRSISETYTQACFIFHLKNIQKYISLAYISFYHMTNINNPFNMCILICICK